MEQLNYNLLFHWFVGLKIDDGAWLHPTFIKKQNRLWEHEVIPELFAKIVKLSDSREQFSTEHFSVNGALIHALGSQKIITRNDSSDDGTLFNSLPSGTSPTYEPSLRRSSAP